MSAWSGSVWPCTIAHAKLERVIALVRGSRRFTSDAEIRAFILDDQLAGDEYQSWLDTASAPLIAACVAAQIESRP